MFAHKNVNSQLLKLCAYKENVNFGGDELHTGKNVNRFPGNCGAQNGASCSPNKCAEKLAKAM